MARPAEGGVDHELDEALSDDGGAEHDGDELVDLLLDLGLEADEVEVAAAVSALAYHALRNGVQARELDAVIFTGRFLLHRQEHLAEAVELANEDVGLVYFVGHDDEVLGGRELEDGADVGLGERGSRRVARVDDDDGTDVGTVALGGIVSFLDRLNRRTPLCGFVEVVRHASGIEDGQ
ncbi:hypothetical protein NPX13_g7465 [Xylaria arbuscula]|uniref:Uncharacterized protein n=1 Tax=Xylaria arbuscula TaxID=114810 RepID=A0A9W8NAA9_9PEZI|nr:hypothetical protein NPX13_g7465 [Xylaria arbuscula]